MAANLGERTTCTCCGSILIICQTCRTPFARGEAEPPAKWGKRRFCSERCAQEIRQKIRFEGEGPATKTCEHCGGTAVQRPTESPATFVTRKFCSRECGNAARRAASAARSAVEEAERARKRAARKAATLENAKKVQERHLIRPVPIVQPLAPAADVWRPSAWRELDQARR